MAGKNSGLGHHLPKGIDTLVVFRYSTLISCAGR